MNSFGNSGKSLTNLSFLKNFSWSNFLDGTQKTLGVINQAMPIVYQIKPVFSNVKTMFRIADELKVDDINTTNVNTNNNYKNDNNLPIFYI